MSNIEWAQRWYDESMNKLRECLATKRGSAEVRAEMTKLRDYVATTGRCPYCGGSAKVRAERHDDCCKDCAQVIDRMLDAKSKILRGSNDPTLIRQMLRWYKSFKVTLPYSLRGSTGVVADVIVALDRAHIAYLNHQYEQGLSTIPEADYRYRCIAIRGMLCRSHPGPGRTLEEMEVRAGILYAIELQHNE